MAENQLCTCAPVADLSDKCAIFRMFAFDIKASNYSTNIYYDKSNQYSNVTEFEFELRHIPSTGSLFYRHGPAVAKHRLLKMLYERLMAYIAVLLKQSQHEAPSLC